MKGDMIVCRKLTIVGQHIGPENRRVWLRIDDLEFNGENSRRPIGQATPIVQRDAIKDLIKVVGRLRSVEYENQAAGVGAVEDDDDGSDQSDQVSVKQEPQDDATSADQKRAPVATATPVPAAPPRLPIRYSPTPKRSPSFQAESQLPAATLQTQLPAQPRNPVRRSRGGLSISREGIEPTRGDNLTGPQAPTLQGQPKYPPVGNSKSNLLLDVMSKLPGQAQRQPTPEPSAPISAQVMPTEIISETPAKRKGSPIPSTDQPPMPIQRRRYRIPKDQRALVDGPATWIPSVGDQPFPHPNVPSHLPKMWCEKAMARAKSSAAPSPLPTAPSQSPVKSVEEMPANDETMPAEESQDEASDSSESEEEGSLPWSSSPPQRQMLPPDSSALRPSPHTERQNPPEESVSSQQVGQSQTVDNAMEIDSSSGPGVDRPVTQKQNSLNRTQQLDTPINLNNSKAATSSPSVTSTSNKASKQTITATQATKNRSNSGLGSAPISHASSQVSAGPQALGPRQSSLAVSSPAARSTTATGAGLQRRPSHPTFPPPSRRPPSASARSASSQYTADNMRGPIQPATQQAPVIRNRLPGSSVKSLPSSSASLPAGTPTGPKGPVRSIADIPDCPKDATEPEPKRRATGDHNRPPTSRARSESSSPDRQETLAQRYPGAVAPLGEIELSVSRRVSASASGGYREERRNYFRDAQRRYW